MTIMRVGPPTRGESDAKAYEVITGPSPWPARYTFWPAVRAGNLLFISGMTAGDESGEIVGPGDIAAQTRYIFERFARLLAAAGGGFEHIVQDHGVRHHHRELRQDRRGAPRVFKGRFPTATGVIVAGLLREGALIEISAIAAPPELSLSPSGRGQGEGKHHADHA